MVNKNLYTVCTTTETKVQRRQRAVNVETPRWIRQVHRLVWVPLSGSEGPVEERSRSSRNFVWDLVRRRIISRCLSSCFLHQGLIDPQSTFIKDEPHAKKVATSRWRLIWIQSYFDSWGHSRRSMSAGIVHHLLLACLHLPLFWIMLVIRLR